MNTHDDPRDDAPTLTGPKSHYRPKTRQTSLALTPHGMSLLAEASAVHRASRADVVENLLRRFWRRVRFEEDKA